ncbi:hypothetical protein EGT74_26505 [Chitinophaga lutea]|uniref:Exo-alpha-sialidase n=1 Tax=Chitinophaga lutea TaxID=2488634 RepID=A0A3N4PQB5_9BACT|nr:hypothetical protein [Chitinophaga lutea]RPE05910.1 hypothetical protein EGT74_26505 [Chitinophaga lutea]
MTSEKKTGWNIVKTAGVDTENASLDFMIVNKSYQLILGSKYTDSDIVSRRFNNYDACIYRSENNGKNWTRKTIGKGKFTSYTVGNNRVFVALGINTKNETALFNDSAKIYCSMDEGRSWKEIAAYKDCHIKSIFIAEDSSVYILGIGKNDNYWILRRTANNGITWSEEMKVLIDYGTLVFFNKALWCINESTKKLIRLSLSDGRVDSFGFPERDFKPLFVRQNMESVLVIGELTQTPMVYKFGDGKFETIMQYGDKNKYPVDLFSYRNQLVLLLGERAGLGVQYYLYWKNELTNAWSAEEMPAKYFKPYAFYEDSFWGYNGGHLYQKTFQ